MREERGCWRHWCTCSQTNTAVRRNSIIALAIASLARRNLETNIEVNLHSGSLLDFEGCSGQTDFIRTQDAGLQTGRDAPLVCLEGDAGTGSFRNDGKVLKPFHEVFLLCQVHRLLGDPMVL